MSTNVSHSIVMRVGEFGESDLLVTFFASDRGPLKGIAKGARKSQKRFANCLDLFCLSDLEYELKGKGDLYFLHSGKLVHAFPRLRSDFSSYSLASYMIELTAVLFPVGVVDQRMFRLLKNCFFALNKGQRKDVLRIFFEVNAMSLGGYGFDLDKCCDCGREYLGEGRAVFQSNRGGIACTKCAQESKASPGLFPDAVHGIKAMQSMSLSDVNTLPLADEMIGEIRAILTLHIEYRTGRRLRTAQYLA